MGGDMERICHSLGRGNNNQIILYNNFIKKRKTHSQPLDWAQNMLKKRVSEELLKEPNTPGEHDLQNELTRTHRWLQNLNQQLESQHGSGLDCWHVCYGHIVWCSCGNPKTESGSCIWYFCLLLVPFFLLLGCLVQHWYEGTCLVLFQLVMVCSLISLGGLLPSEEKWRRSGSWGEGRCGLRTWMKEWRKNCAWGIIFERRSNKNMNKRRKVSD